MQYLKTFTAFLFLALAISMAPPGQAHAEDAALSTAQKEEVQKLIKAYIEEHGGEIIDSVRNHQEKQAKEDDAKAEAKIGDHLATLTGPDVPSAGNASGDVTVVEFFDYNCGYCKKVAPEIQKIVESDKNVRFVLMEMPILGPTSHTAAQWALAAHKQGKYFEYHMALMNHQGPKNDEVLEKSAKDIGLDVAQAKKDIVSKDVQDMLEKSVKISGEIGIQGTPAFIVNGKLYRGYLGDDGLKSAIEEARKNKKGG